MNDDLILVGDTLLTRRQHRYLYSNNTVKRHGFSSGKNHWPRGEVPVVISPQLNQNYQQLIKEAAQCIEKVSCVKFVFNFNPRDHPNYVKIIYKKNVCYSLIGYVRQGEQNIQLDPNKCKKGTIIHEMLHTLGLFHMHTAVDRDKYVKINWNNIKPGFKDAFEKYTNGVSMFRTSYDYQSLMHYPAYSHAIDSSKPTIVPLQKIDIPDMGQNQSNAVFCLFLIFASNFFFYVQDWLKATSRGSTGCTNVRASTENLKKKSTNLFFNKSFFYRNGPYVYKLEVVCIRRVWRGSSIGII